MEYPESHKIFYESKKFCCNPLQFEYHSSRKKNKKMNKVTEKTLELFHRLGSTWVTKDMCVCCFCKVRARERLENLENINGETTPVKNPPRKRFRSISPDYWRRKVVPKPPVEVEIEEVPIKEHEPDSDWSPDSDDETPKIVNRGEKEGDYLKASSEVISDILKDCKNDMKIKIIRAFTDKHAPCEIMRNLPGTTEYMISKAKKPEQKDKPKLGKPGIPPEVVSKIKQFYCSGLVGYCIGFWDMDDRTRVLVHTLKDLHKMYLERCEDERDKVSFSSFAKLRPEHCTIIKSTKKSVKK